MSTLAGMGVGGAVGGLSSALVGLGAPEYEAKRYEDYVRDGGILMSVHVDNVIWTRRAKTILESTGAHDIAVVQEMPNDRNFPPPPSSGVNEILVNCPLG